MVCKKYHTERTVPLVHTVGKEILESGDDYFLLGSTEMENFPRLLKLAQKDCYYSLVEKAIKSLEYHYLVNTPFEWYFIGDDDTFVNVSHINNLVNSLSNAITHPTEYFVVGSTRHPSGIEQSEDGAVSIKGGAGILMNKATFLALRNISHSFNHNAKYWGLQDSTIDLLINLHNSNMLYHPTKQIAYMHCNEFYGDRNCIEEDKIHNAITLHNRFYGHSLPGRTSRTMYELLEMSKKEAVLGSFSYYHRFSPSREYIEKVCKGVY
jgi:hypothetical protein